ncbi:MAG: class II fructose-bisphosphate aldolase [Candidatus Omnitrophica bacterium]|nr:class II fructose-bisphosphate aldolase [Candidatus Omnitrophota bacterium]MBU2044423.1 class II fructose-bisphosphate aldolase [Candidatus Omnitrophota bacterium]MBU2250655.1 class II fructose-bisphosphate aldolase [Candidatus Omnitrophota bacterium]MBU2473737.1 class II fructose-bisphosphate aldolase [Candidatus Omnitrophota bacterium]
MIYTKEVELLNNKGLKTVDGRVKVIDEKEFRAHIIDNLLDTIVLGVDPHLRRLSYWVAYSAGVQLGVVPASIQELYTAMGQGKVKGFTVPAMNIRTLTFDLARAVFRSAKKINAGAFIFEIAKSEIGYTDQRPLEYSSVITLAALKEGYHGPIFIQGDHFQLKAANYLKDREKEISQLEVLLKEAISAHFYNIDIDSSTLVDLSKDNLNEQQRNNYEVCVEISRYIRKLQPAGINISIGGEIGEVGGKNSTPEELDAFMQGYLNSLGSQAGISKISIQTGTSHGGVVLPDGSIAKVSIDFDTLAKLSEIARKKYGLAGAVQHGASTLPNEAFHRFSEVGCAEIHLATQFQNMVYDYLPLPLKEEIYAWLHTNCAGEKKPDWTDDQFIYKTRKTALGPFKKKIHSLSRELKDKISLVLEEEFSFLFEQLKIKDTKNYVDQYITLLKTEKEKNYFLGEEKDLGELEGAD